MLRNGIIGSLFFLLAHCVDAQVMVIVESLPSATPSSDTIFITGTFNNWAPNDQRYALQRQLNGQFAVVIPGGEGKIEFKFTRGTWMKVETSSQNKYTDNRVFEHGSADKIYVRIDNWLDLGGARPLNYAIFYFFACAFQAIALTLIAYRIQKNDKIRGVRPLLVINVTVTSLLAILILRETINQVWQNYLTFLFHIALFCWGPLLLFFIESFHSPKKHSRIFPWLMPAFLAVCFVLVRVINLSVLAFLSQMVWAPFTRAGLLVVGTGFLFNVIVHFSLYRKFSFLRSRTSAATPKTRFLYYAFLISASSLLLIPVSVLLIRMGVNNSFIEEFHLIAFSLSALLYLETWFLWRYPEILKEEKTVPAHAEGSQHWMERVNALMKEQKPYTNPDLSISDLASMLGTKPHILSKIIHDSYQRNFRDFVNTYRIQEFIRLANTKEYRHYTFLALAQEIGFNSKSTFNLAFKKVTNRSPREYFKSKELT